MEKRRKCHGRQRKRDQNAGIEEIKSAVEYLNCSIYRLGPPPPPGFGNWLKWVANFRLWNENVE